MDALREDFVKSSAHTQFLVDMVPGGKPYTNVSGQICIGHPGALQGVWRYAFGENQESSVAYATAAIQVYQAFLERTLEHVRWNRLFSKDTEFFVSTRAHTESVLDGLRELSRTYDGCDDIAKICSKFESTISLFDVGCSRYSNGVTTGLFVSQHTN
jgi:hypothetical protein